MHKLPCCISFIRLEAPQRHTLQYGVTRATNIVVELKLKLESSQSSKCCDSMI